MDTQQLCPAHGATEVTQLKYTYGTLIINGKRTIAYSITPDDHTSACFPSYRFLYSSTSGAASQDEDSQPCACLDPLERCVAQDTDLKISGQSLTYKSACRFCSTY